MIRALGTIFAGLLGLAFGSFLNVCVSRWPAGESVVRPRSHCRACGRTLAWWENLPVVSWIALRGRCRTCGAGISVRYVLVELAVGGLWSLQAWRFFGAVGLPGGPLTDVLLVDAAGKMIFYWMLAALAVLDAENLWLPDRITFPGIAIGFALTLFLGPLDDYWWCETVTVKQAAVDDLLAILLSAALILLIRWVYWLVRRREGMGLGDVKLMALLAAWLGLSGALLAFFLGVLLGALAAVSMLLVPRSRRGAEAWSASKLPFGTFLCIGGIVSALCGHPILAAYMRWAGF